MAANGLGVFLCLDLGIDYPDVRRVPLVPALENGTVVVWKRHGAASSAAAEFARFLRG